MAANRWEAKNRIVECIRNKDLLVVNRYIHSNLAYGIANGIDKAWLTKLEEGLPQPKLVVLIDMPSANSLKRKSYQRDIHEQNIEYLEKVRQVYLELAKEQGWKVVDGCKSKKDVHVDIWKQLSESLKKLRS